MESGSKSTHKSFHFYILRISQNRCKAYTEMEAHPHGTDEEEQEEERRRNVDGLYCVYSFKYCLFRDQIY